MEILLSAALFPALALMAYVFFCDHVEKEPAGLLLKLALLGALSCLPAAILEEVFFYLAQQLALPAQALLFVEAFFIIALAEEGCKLFFLKKGSWRAPAFDYRFDGIVYAVFVSLGFAALENVLYLTSAGLGIAVSRGLLSVPGHMTFAVFMGLHYANAKQHAVRGDLRSYRRSMRKALWVPVMLHGFYDFCLMSGSLVLVAVFLVFVVVLDVAAFRTIRKQSREDRPFEEPFFF